MGYRNVPLVINTQGWTKGMGFDLLTFFLLEVKPSYIIQTTPDISHPIGTFDSIYKKLPTDTKILYLESISELPVRYSLILSRI